MPLRDFGNMNKEFKFDIVATLILGIVMLLSSWLSGCVQQHKHVSAPSTTAVQTGINKAQLGVANARGENQALGRGNEKARTLTQRIHDKDILIDRWRATHGE